MNPHRIVICALCGEERNFAMLANHGRIFHNMPYFDEQARLQGRQRSARKVSTRVSCGTEAAVGKAGLVANTADSRRSESQQISAGLGAGWGIPPAGSSRLDDLRLRSKTGVLNVHGTGTEFATGGAQ